MAETMLRPERVEDLESLLAGTTQAPLLVYKHSFTCGTSAYALDELTELMARRPGLRVAFVGVQTHRDVSNEIARRLGVRHETPQVLLVVDGRAVWHASHFRVTADAVEGALTGHPPGAR